MQEMSYTVSEDNIEQDELNIHECMLPLMKLLDHMEHNKITPEVAQVYIHVVGISCWHTSLCKFL